MSDARTAAVELFIESWNQREIEAVLEITSDDFEYVNPPNAVEPGVRRGPEGIRHVMEAQWDALGEDARLEIDRIYPPEGDQVIAQGNVSRGMPGSDARVENRIVLGWTFKEDRVIRLEVLGAGSSYHDALAKAGLSEP
jgi:ketosteroid isomerase-like protein